MPFVSVTRLRVRSLRYLPAFFIYASRATRQASSAGGFLGGALLPDRRWTFWTLTMWQGAGDMRAYIISGAHKTVMPKLMLWCDEASIAHWEQAESVLPDWAEAEAQMRERGRPSKVLQPSPGHLSMAFAPLRPGEGAPINPKR